MVFFFLLLWKSFENSWKQTEFNPILRTNDSVELLKEFEDDNKNVRRQCWDWKTGWSDGVNASPYLSQSSSWKKVWIASMHLPSSFAPTDTSSSPSISSLLLHLLVSMSLAGSPILAVFLHFLHLFYSLIIYFSANNNILLMYLPTKFKTQSWFLLPTFIDSSYSSLYLGNFYIRIRFGL